MSKYEFSRTGDDSFLLSENGTKTEYSVDFGSLVIDMAGGRIVGVEIWQNADAVINDIESQTFDIESHGRWPIPFLLKAVRTVERFLIRLSHI